MFAVPDLFGCLRVGWRFFRKWLRSLRLAETCQLRGQLKIEFNSINRFKTKNFEKNKIQNSKILDQNWPEPANWNLVGKPNQRNHVNLNSPTASTEIWRFRIKQNIQHCSHGRSRDSRPKKRRRFREINVSWTKERRVSVNYRKDTFTALELVD